MCKHAQTSFDLASANHISDEAAAAQASCVSTHPASWMGTDSLYNCSFTAVVILAMQIKTNPGRAMRAAVTDCSVDMSADTKWRHLGPEHPQLQLNSMEAASA